MNDYLLAALARERAERLAREAARAALVDAAEGGHRRPQRRWLRRRGAVTRPRNP